VAAGSIVVFHAKRRLIVMFAAKRSPTAGRRRQKRGLFLGKRVERRRLAERNRREEQEVMNGKVVIMIPKAERNRRRPKLLAKVAEAVYKTGRLYRKDWRSYNGKWEIVTPADGQEHYLLYSPYDWNLRFYHTEQLVSVHPFIFDAIRAAEKALAKDDAEFETRMSEREAMVLSHRRK
jgi:hypothetical protein